MRRLLIAIAFAVVPLSAMAQTSSGQTLTVGQVIELSKAGLGEEALLALIEVNRPVFPVDVDTLKGLKDAGVAPTVIVAMIRSGRTGPPALPEPMPLPPGPVDPPTVVQQPPVVVLEHHSEPAVREVPVAVPVYVAVPVRRVHDGHPPSRPPVVKPPRKVEPVYWGWGGKLRPDAWKPAIERQKDAKVPRTPQKK